ncbi:MAG: beta-phosphoglucomutase family hydrolase [Solirubrobacteraceae bacterium]
MLGLPDGIKACLFDLDGVLTQTAKVHAKAWKEMFDGFLETQEGQKPFDAHADYDEYVDGKPREAGVRDFLKSRGIELPEGEAGDGADQETVNGLGARKNGIVQKVIERDGVEPYEGSVRYLKAARDAGLRRAVVSSSHNCEAVLKAAGIEHLLEARVDGDTAVEEGLKGKPAPDMFLAGAKAVGVEPSEAAVFEDALVGVEAGRAGSFGHVVGVDRVGQREALTDNGADVVVDDLAELL